MQRRQTGTKIALLISLILHLAVFLTLRGVILHVGTHEISDTINIDLVNLPSSATPPPPHISERVMEPLKRRRTPPVEAVPGRFSADKLPPRPIVTNTDENIPESEIPVVDTIAPMKAPLPSTLSSAASATGASSRGRETGKGAGSGRGGHDSGGLVSVSPRGIPVEEGSISEKLQIYTEADLPFIKALQEIAQHVVDVRKSRKVDIVFIIDTSESMQDDIDAVRRHLSKMINRFQEASLDFTLGVVRFHHSIIYEWLGMDITVSPQTSNMEEIRRILRSITVSGGELALDALMKAISEVKFRPDTDRHFILVTDEYVKGTYPAAEVLRAAKRAKITIDVLGRDEPFQRTIAEQTGGIWTSIKKIKGGD